MRINLFASELAMLLHEHSVDYNDADFEKFFFELQTKVEIPAGTMELQDEDVRQIQQFAFDYGNQKWKRELRAIFGRTLGEDLDGSVVVEKVATEEWQPRRRSRPEWERRCKTHQGFASPVAD